VEEIEEIEWGFWHTAAATMARSKDLHDILIESRTKALWSLAEQGRPVGGVRVRGMSGVCDSHGRCASPTVANQLAVQTSFARPLSVRTGRIVWLAWDQGTHS
jgi:hypothetical protein